MFGDVLKRLRKESDLTQRDLGRLLGVSESTIGMYERNQREPAFEMLEAIADYFNVDMDYLTDRTTIKRAVSYSPAANILPMPKMNTVPLIGTIACGDPILATENIEAEVSMPEHVVADFALRCKGDSIPTSLSSIRKTRSMSPLSISARRSAPSASWASPSRLRAM